MSDEEKDQVFLTCSLCGRSQPWIYGVVKHKELFSSNRLKEEYKHVCNHCASVLHYKLDLKKVFDRIESLEKMIKDHALGVQNVYEQFSRILDFESIFALDLDKMDKMKKIIKLCKDLSKCE